ncbi:MAG: primosomal protein N' [Rhodocyclaceae bacterium]
MAILKVALDLPVPRLFDYLAGDAGSADVGLRVLVPFGQGRRLGVILAVEEESDLAPERLRTVEAILRDEPRLPAETLRLIRFCSGYYHHPIGEVAALALPPALKSASRTARPRPAPAYRITEAGRVALAGLPGRSRRARLLEALAVSALTRATLTGLASRVAPELAALEAAGWIEAAPLPRPAEAAVGVDLREEQRWAVEAVKDAAGRFAPFLLFGVTGSGKTEVYLELIRDALETHRQTLVLVPEIGLTPQLLERIAARFPGAQLVSLHSALPEGERLRGYLRALSGEADIVLGTRLAVFTPLERLGLILVDEEHDPSFKQQEGVRYSARDLAIVRARARGVPIVLGSATPALESFHNASTGRYRLLRLERRAREAALPNVRCIDTRRMSLEEGLSPPLIEAIGERLARGEQSLIFLNRRGYAPVLSCPACAWVSRCRDCSANLVVHLAERALRCHHCGHREPLARVCPECGNQDLRPVGRGTQRLEAALAARLPSARIVRADRDSVRSIRQWRSLLAAVRSGDTDVLVGTQMLAKGHDFPMLTLVGVVNADASLFAADFRAPERLFAQLMQVAGRSGRAALPGEVLIQTEFPNHPLFSALVAQDYPRFAASQLEERRQAGFPPWRFQALLRAQSRVMDEALEFLAAAARQAAGYACEVTLYDPVPMRLARKAGWERAQMLVESVGRPAIQHFLDRWVPGLYAIRHPAELRWHIDVDPLEF